MKNQEALAKLIMHVSMLEHANSHHIERDTDIISAAFSAIGTSSPAAALDLIDQMNAQRPKLEAMKQEREAAYTALAKTMQGMTADLDSVDETGDDDGDTSH